MDSNINSSDRAQFFSRGTGIPVSRYKKIKLEEIPPVNNSYDYDTSDINFILEARLRQLNVTNYTVLASAVLEPGTQTGLSSAQILDQAFDTHINTIQSFPHNLILPINSGGTKTASGHWVGIRIELLSKNQNKVTYYDSLKNKSTNPSDSVVINKINADLRNFEKYKFSSISYPARPCYYQEDHHSCGAYLIENIVSDLSNAWDNHDKISADSIRKLHLTTLQLLEPDFYITFCNRQSNINAVHKQSTSNMNNQFTQNNVEDDSIDSFENLVEIELTTSRSSSPALFKPESPPHKMQEEDINTCITNNFEGCYGCGQ